MVLGLTAVAVSACSHDGNETSVDAHLEATLRFEQYFGLPGAESRDLLQFGADEDQRVQASIVECMRAAGFDYQAPAPVEHETAVLPGMRPERTWVEENGLSVLLGPAEDTERTTDTVPFGADLSEQEHGAYLEVLFGEGGCHDTATSSHQSAEAVLTAYDDHLGEIFGEYLADPSVTEADALWGACMRAVGYEFSNLDQLVSDLVRRVEEAAGDEAALRDLEGYERKAALAAYDCDEEPSELREAVVERLANEFRREYGQEIIEKLASR